ncbi:MAG: 30S ribosomal protein S9 [Candidatus Altiarchaeota archaeon]|nr:30S ribosomal protein S9 [Candidatus Altiarchaeota archaeon]
MKKTAHSPGKRKRAIARATITEGKGNVRINSTFLDVLQPPIARDKIRVPLMLAADYVDLGKIDFNVNVAGGGPMGQADAVASSIARALLDWTESDELLSVYHQYDRTLIAGDHRLTEPHKPSQSSKGPRHKRQKSYR